MYYICRVNIKQKRNIMKININNIKGLYIETPYYGEEKAYLTYKSGKKIRLSINQYNSIVKKRRLNLINTQND